jgi:steroid delta-isomerase-like uncharacterized protein
MNPVERLRAYYAAFNAKSWDDMLACVHDEVLHYPNQGTLREGKAAFKEFVLQSGRAYDEHLSDIAIFICQGNDRRLGAEYLVNGTYLVADPGFPAAHGQKYTLPGGAFFELRDGLIGRITNYYNLEDWLAQVRE